MKLTGIILIAVSCAALGALKAWELAYRVKQIEEYISFLTNLKADISFCTAPVSELVEMYKNSEISKMCIKQLEKGEEFPIAWSNTVKKTGLKGEEKEILINFGVNFGLTDVQGQILQTELCIERLKALLEKAKAEKEQKYKLNITLGIAGGLAAAAIIA